MKLSKYISEFETLYKESIDLHKIFSKINTNNGREYFHSLHIEKFFYPSPPVSMEFLNGKLGIRVRKHKIKTLYISYLTLDTNFNKIPEMSFLNINESKAFYIDMDIQHNDTIELIPYIIHYNDNGKKRMTRITKRNQFIISDEDIVKIRLVIKVNGYGNFTINNIKTTDIG